jgi:hypothetical protein
VSVQRRYRKVIKAKAKQDGVCADCCHPIYQGQEIKSGPNGWRHVAGCADRRVSLQRDARPMLPSAPATGTTGRPSLRAMRGDR